MNARDYKLGGWGALCAWAGQSGAEQQWLLMILFFALSLAILIWAGDPPKGAKT